MTDIGMITSLLLADQKAKKLEKEGIEVPSNFKTKAIVFGSMIQNPLASFLLIESEAKKLENENSGSGSVPDTTPDEKEEVVKGVLYDLEGKPVAGAQVSLEESVDGLQTETDEEGRFEIAAKAGDFLLIKHEYLMKDFIRMEVKEQDGLQVFMPIKGSTSTPRSDSSQEQVSKKKPMTGKQTKK